MPLDARGVAFDESLVAEAATAVSDSKCRWVRLDDAVFEAPFVIRKTRLPALYARSARFQRGVDLRGVTFDGHVSFSSAQIDGDAQFSASEFTDGLDLSTARVSGVLKLGWDLPAATGLKDPARIDGDLVLEQVEVSGHINLARISVQGTLAGSEMSCPKCVIVSEASVRDRLNLSYAVIGGDLYGRGLKAARVDLHLGRFRSNVNLRESRIARDFDMAEAQVGGDVDLARVHLDDCRRLGPLYSRGTVDLSGLSAPRRLALILGAERVRLRNAILPSGMSARIRWADVDLSGSDLSSPSTISRHHPEPPSKHALRLDGGTGSRIGDWATFFDPAMPRPTDRPSIAEMAGADVSGLTLADVDLTSCTFAGALNLADLQIGPSCRTLTTQDFPDCRPWWTARQAIHDERLARTPVARPGGPVRSPSPAQVADAYRQLRRGREQRGDQPGASDFYYGEMEMRRRASNSGPERLTLTLYWLLSGYGLRASRAIVALAILVGLSAVALDQFHAPLTGIEPVLLSVELATALSPGASELSDSVAARIVRMPLRILGPVLIALAVVAIRERVKR